MGLLRKIFGPSRDEIWSRLSHELSGRFVDGGWLGKTKVEVEHEQWCITLDTFTVSSGKNSTTYTRLRAPYVNKDGFRFTIYRKSIFSGLGKMFGMQDIEVGHQPFDADFIIKSNNEEKLRLLFSNQGIRQLVRVQPRIHLTVKDDEGWFGSRFPDGVDELYFQTVGVIKDLGLLKDLFFCFPRF